MKLLKDKKTFLNLILCIIAVLPFFVLLGSMLQFDAQHTVYVNFYSFLQKNSSFAANFIFLFIIIINFCLLTYNFVYSLVKTPKSLQNLIILSISAALNVGIIAFAFLLGDINGIKQFISMVPIFVAMLSILSIVFELVRLILEIKNEEK